MGEKGGDWDSDLLPRILLVSMWPGWMCLLWAILLSSSVCDALVRLKFMELSPDSGPSVVLGIYWVSAWDI